MIDYSLPTSINVAGKDLEIRSDYRAILDCISILNAPDLDSRERAIAFLTVFYVHPEEIEDYGEAIQKALSLISNGTDESDTGRSYMDWEKDFKYIVAAVNAICKRDIRSDAYMHWWTLWSYVAEADPKSMLCSIVSIRYKKAKGKKLEEYEREFYRKHKKDIDLPIRHTKEEEELLQKLWDGIE